MPKPITKPAKSESMAPRKKRVPRGVAGRLRDALLALSQHRAQILDHQERSWASITFSGTRHRLTLYFMGDDAVEAGEQFIAELPDHEFTLAGQLVAEATVTEAEHRMAPSPRLVVYCELLLLEEA